jgi:hypothetical protein
MALSKHFQSAFSSHDQCLQRSGANPNAKRSEDGAEFSQL